MPSTNERIPFTVDGINYEFEGSSTLICTNQSIDVYHQGGNDFVANAYIDHNLEQIVVDVADRDDVMIANYFELADSPEKLVRWIMLV